MNAYQEKDVDIGRKFYVKIVIAEVEELGLEAIM